MAKKKKSSKKSVSKQGMHKMPNGKMMSDAQMKKMMKGGMR